MSHAPTLEYLGTPERERRRTPLVVAIALVLACTLAAGFVWWTDAVRRSANDGLVAAFIEASAKADSGERSVQGTLAYASPLIWSAAVPESVRDGLRALVEASAADVAEGLGTTRARVMAVRILPWQAAQQDARREVLKLVEAQQARFAGIARDASDIDIILADGPLPTGAALESLRASGADGIPQR